MLFADFFGNRQLCIMREVGDCLWTFEILEKYRLQIEKIKVDLLRHGPTFCVHYSSFAIKSIIGLVVLIRNISLNILKNCK